MFFKKKVEYILVFAIATIYAFLVFLTHSEYKQLPSPLYGGDYYHQLGQIYHMYESSPLEWFSGNNMLNRLPSYMPLYGILVTIFGKLLGLNPMQALIYFDAPIAFFCPILWFLFFRDMFKDWRIGLVGAAAAGYSLFLKYTAFNAAIMAPLLFYSALIFYRNKSTKNSVLFGVVWGLSAISHSVGFFYPLFLMGTFFAVDLWKNRQNVREYFLEIKWGPIALVFIIGFIIAQVFWFQPIFIYHGKTPLKNSIWGIIDFRNTEVQVGYLIITVQRNFFDFSSAANTLLSILKIIGAYVLIKQVKEEHEFLFIMVFSTFVAVFSYFITSPLFDMHFVPPYIEGTYLVWAAFALGILGLKFLMEKFGGYARYTAFALVILLVAEKGAEIVNQQQSQWGQVAMRELQPYVLEGQAWILKNTKVNDVFLSTNELSFALNALTGRKVMISRRAHCDPFVDYDRRMLDAAIILYGNDVEKKKELLKKYEVKYIYVDVGWASSEWTIEENRITGMYDPMMLFDSPENRQELEKYGIKYIAMKTWVDPSMKTTEYRLFDVLIVSPENYDNSGYGPWKDDLDALIEPVWKYSEGWYDIVKIYRVKE